MTIHASTSAPFWSDFSQCWMQVQPSGFARPVNDLHTTVAAEFDQLLRWHLRADDYAAMIAANAAETHANVCHSHDYADANETMAVAIVNALGMVGRDAEIDFNAPHMVTLWHEAWQTWRKLSR